MPDFLHLKLTIKEQELCQETHIPDYLIRLQEMV